LSDLFKKNLPFRWEMKGHGKVNEYYVRMLLAR
jgi:hypothetical protein